MASQDQCVSPLSALQDLASAVSLLSIGQVDLQGVQGHVKDQGQDQGHVKGPCVSHLVACYDLDSAVFSLLAP